MPEIPDLNIFSKNLSKQLSNKKLEAISILVPRRLKVPESALKEISVEPKGLMRCLSICLIFNNLL